MELSITSLNKGSTSKITVSDVAFACEFKEGLIHQVVTAYQAAGRQGTKGQKSRSDVSGGGAKPWRQKGTGRARAGTSRSPIWRSGGVTFAAKNRDFSKKVNRKMYRGAIASILSELLRKDRLKVIDDLQLKEPKTKPLALVLEKLKLGKVLIVIPEENRNLILASRNIPNVCVCLADKVSPADLLGYENVLMTSAAVKQIEERLT